MSDDDNEMIFLGDVAVPRHISNRVLGLKGDKEFVVHREEGDGHCGFRAISRLLFNVPDHFLGVRGAALRTMQSDQGRYEPLASESFPAFPGWEAYIQQHVGASLSPERTNAWCDQACLQAISDVYHRKILLLSTAAADYAPIFEPVGQANNANVTPLVLIMHEGSHFDCVSFYDKNVHDEIIDEEITVDEVAVRAEIVQDQGGSHPLEMLSPPRASHISVIQPLTPSWSPNAAVMGRIDECVYFIILLINYPGGEATAHANCCRKQARSVLVRMPHSLHAYGKTSSRFYSSKKKPDMDDLVASVNRAICKASSCKLALLMSEVPIEDEFFKEKK